jgi:cardiolipin synthase
MAPLESASTVPAGDVEMRIVASEPATAAMKLDQLVASLARHRLWLTDAYYAGTTPYVEALRAAARDGVDVRLLVPNATDIPRLRPLSRAGYRPLLEAGVRVFEWNGSMLHAKTALADGPWARVGSTNLNIASWFGNCELDAVIEHEAFAAQMEAMYVADLHNATEVVLDRRHRLAAPGAPRTRLAATSQRGGSACRAAAGAIRVGNTIGAAFTNRRVLEPIEARLTTIGGAVACALAIVCFPVRWPIRSPRSRPARASRCSTAATGCTGEGSRRPARRDRQARRKWPRRRKDGATHVDLVSADPIPRGGASAADSSFHPRRLDGGGRGLRRCPSAKT